MELWKRLTNLFKCVYNESEKNLKLMQKKGDNMKYRTHIFEVANYFLSKESMEPKKLQKLVYYAYCYYLVANNSEKNITNFLFDERPEAWIHGPVFPTLYQKYKIYNWNNISKQKMVNIFQEDIYTVLDYVWKKYGCFSSDSLEYMTHQENPWKKARTGIDPFVYSNKKIELKYIFESYTDVACKN